MQTKLVAAFVLCASLALSQTAMGHSPNKKIAKKHAKAAATKANAAAPAAAQGLVVAIDPATRQIRQPEADEMTALASQTPASAGPQAAPAERIGTDGSVGVMMDDSTMSFAVAKKNADGSVSFECVSGAERAKSAVKKPASAKKEELDVQ